MSAVAIKEMKKSEVMWQKYYNDFVHYYLHFSAKPDSLEHKLLQKTFFNNCDEMKILKPIAVHCYMHLHQLDLARMVPSLKSLGQLQLLNEGQESEGEESTLNDTLGEPTNNSIPKFVIKSLFAVFVKAMCSKDLNSRLNILQQWFNSYKDMVSPCINGSYVCNYRYIMLFTLYLVFR